MKTQIKDSLHCDQNKLMFECSDNGQFIIIKEDSPGMGSDANKPTFDRLEDGELINDEVILYTY